MPVSYDSAVAWGLFIDISPNRLSRTLDGGDNWTFIGNTDMSALAVKPDDESTLYAVIDAGDKKRLMKSTNQGDTFAQVGNLMPADGMRNIVRLRSGVILVQNVSGAGQVDIARSTDEGQSWATKTITGHTLRPYSIRQSRNSDKVFLAGQRDSDGAGILFYSSDDGLTWTAGYVFSDTTHYLNSLFSTKGGSLLGMRDKQVGNGMQVWRSTDEGLTFAMVLEDTGVSFGDLNLNVADVFSQYESGSFADRIILCRKYKSVDDGQTWQLTGAGQLTEGAGHVKDAVWHGAGQGNGSWQRSTDGGTTWASNGQSGQLIQLLTPSVGEAPGQGGQGAIKQSQRLVITRTRVPRVKPSRRLARVGGPEFPRRPRRARR